MNNVNSVLLSLKRENGSVRFGPQHLYLIRHMVSNVEPIDEFQLLNETGIDERNIVVSYCDPDRVFVKDLDSNKEAYYSFRKYEIEEGQNLIYESNGYGADCRV